MKGKCQLWRGRGALRKEGKGMYREGRGDNNEGGYCAGRERDAK
jgi:hypothetical protein